MRHRAEGLRLNSLPDTSHADQIAHPLPKASRARAAAWRHREKIPGSRLLSRREEQGTGVRQQRWLATRNPRRYMTVAYTASLGLIAVLSVLVHLLLERVIAEQGDTGWTVNRSGQQRMLTQRASMFTLRFIATGDAGDRKLAEQALSRLESNRDALLAAHREALAAGTQSPLSEGLQALYFSPPDSVMERLDSFIVDVRAALAAPKARGVAQNSRFFQLASGPLLEGLDRVVSAYEAESVGRVATLRRVQRLVLAILLVTLACEALFIFRPMVRYIVALTSQLERQAGLDHLSGLANRRTFSVLAEQMLRFAERYQQPLCLLLLDIDHFKRVNDGHGHAAGDEAIRAVALALITQTRAADVVARVGGEEFAVLAPNTALTEGLLLAEKLRRIVRSTTRGLPGSGEGLTISVGLTVRRASDQSVEDIMHRADGALYAAKDGGRDRCCNA